MTEQTLNELKARQAELEHLERNAWAKYQEDQKANEAERERLEAALMAIVQPPSQLEWHKIYSEVGAIKKTVALIESEKPEGA